MNPEIKKGRNSNTKTQNELKFFGLIIRPIGLSGTCHCQLDIIEMSQVSHSPKSAPNKHDWS